MDKFLIVGLGNIGESYENTRHNIGFSILDYLAKVQEFDFTLEKHAAVGKTKIKSKQRSRHEIYYAFFSFFFNLFTKILDDPFLMHLY